MPAGRRLAVQTRPSSLPSALLVVDWQQTVPTPELEQPLLIPKDSAGNRELMEHATIRIAIVMVRVVTEHLRRLTGQVRRQERVRYVTVMLQVTPCRGSTRVM